MWSMNIVFADAREVSQKMLCPNEATRVGGEAFVAVQICEYQIRNSYKAQ